MGLGVGGLGFQGLVFKDSGLQVSRLRFRSNATTKDLHGFDLRVRSGRTARCRVKPLGKAGTLTI